MFVLFVFRMFYKECVTCSFYFVSGCGVLTIQNAYFFKVLLEPITLCFGSNSIHFHSVIFLESLRFSFHLSMFSAILGKNLAYFLMFEWYLVKLKIIVTY